MEEQICNLQADKQSLVLSLKKDIDISAYERRSEKEDTKWILADINFKRRQAMTKERLIRIICIKLKFVRRIHFKKL